MYCRSLSVIIFFLALAVGEIATGGNNLGAKQPGAQRRLAAVPINDFVLTDQRDAPFELSNLTGQVVIVAFAYTTCPDVCPLITASLRQVQIGLTREERKQVHLLTVTTDPEIDAPKVLSAYGKRYGADFDNWSFLTGEVSALGKVWRNFGVGVKRKGRGLVDHTPLTAIVDQKRLMRFAYVGPSPDSKAVLRDVRALLSER
jgi:protein SCO1/2